MNKIGHLTDFEMDEFKKPTNILKLTPTTQTYLSKILTVEDYLYLPSNVTINRREEMQRKFGSIMV